MPPDVIEELHLQLAEYIQMQTLHQEVHEEHSGSCAMHHGPSHSLAHVDGVVPSSKSSSPSASSPKAATAAAAAASSPLLVGSVGSSAVAATAASSANSDIPVDSVALPGVLALAAASPVGAYPPHFETPPLPKLTPAQQIALVRRFIRNMRRVEPVIVERALEAVRLLPEAALMQAHGFLLLSWVTFGREALLVKQDVLGLARKALTRFPHDRFLLACTSSLYRALASADSTPTLQVLLKEKSILTLQVCHHPYFFARSNLWYLSAFPS
jgi:hypothetical protein